MVLDAAVLLPDSSVTVQCHTTKGEQSVVRGGGWHGELTGWGASSR